MSWWRRFSNTRRMDGELDRELGHHIELMVAERMRAGMSEAEARREARLEFGGMAQISEECRESRGTMLVSTAGQDLRFAARQLLRNPGFTIVTVLTLGLGIGATTAIFSVVNATLLRPLPFKDPARLVMLWSSIPDLGYEGPGSLTDPGYAEWRSQNKVFEEIAAFRGQTSNLTGSGIPERLHGVSATASLFPVLGVAPELGRVFSADEQMAGRESVVVISHALWAKRFGSDAAIVGRTIRLDDKNFAVLGVMPGRFEFPDRPDFWMPLVLTGDRSNAMDQIVARLAPGVSLQRVMEDVKVMRERSDPSHHASDIHLGFAFLKDKMVENIRPALIVLLSAVGLVLLIACANVANLFLTRATARRQEIAMRRALGASRMRIVRQLLTESTLLAMVGGALGVVIALVTRQLLVGLLPESAAGPGVLLQAVTSDIDAWVLGFSFLIAVVTGVLFGLAPALSVSRPDLQASMKAASKAHAAEARSRRIRSALIVGEFALTLVLLVAAGLLLRSFVRLLDVSPGFEPRNVAIVNLELPETRYGTREQMIAFHDALLSRVASLPQVRAAGTIGFGMPFGGGGVSGDFTVKGQAPQPVVASKLAVSSSYFSALGVPWVEGRTFNQDDTAKSAHVLIVSQSFARRFWPGQSAVGKAIDPGFRGMGWCTIVGVVGDVKQDGLGSEAPLTIYMPYAQAPDFLMSFMTVAVRTDGAPMDMVHALRAQVQAVDGEIPIFDAASMDGLIAKSVAQPRLNSVLLGCFAALALILAAVGIYGVISCSVAERRHEIGIRMALGAGPQSMTRMVVREGAVLAAMGIAIGAAAALAVSRLIAAFLFAVEPTDPATFCAVSALLALVALAASYIPARRAARVDPMVALRYE